MKTRTIKGIDHLLFDNEDEFNKHMPNTPIITDWRKGNEGDWVLSDDGQICQVLKKGGLKNGASENIYNYYIRTIIGSFVCRSTVTMDGDMRKNIYAFGATDKTPYQIVKNRKKPTNKEFLFAKYVAKGEDTVEAFMKAFPAKSKEYAKSESKLLMSTKRIQGLIREEIEKVINQEGTRKFGVGQTLYYEMPFFTNPKYHIKKWVWDVLEDYRLVTKFNIPLGKDLDNICAIKLDMFGIIEQEINNIKKHKAESDG